MTRANREVYLFFAQHDPRNSLCPSVVSDGHTESNAPALLQRACRGHVFCDDFLNTCKNAARYPKKPNKPKKTKLRAKRCFGHDLGKPFLRHVMNQRVATRTWHFLLFRPSRSSLLCPSPLAPQLFAGPPLSPLPSGDSFFAKKKERERKRERPRWTSIYETELLSEELVLGTRLSRSLEAASGKKLTAP